MKDRPFWNAIKTRQEEKVAVEMVTMTEDTLPIIAMIVTGAISIKVYRVVND